MMATTMFISSLVLMTQLSIFVLAEITYSDDKGREHFLDGYKAHFQFSKFLESVMETKIKPTLDYTLKYYNEDLGRILSGIDYLNYGFLHLFHSLLINDVSFANLFMGYFNSKDSDFTNYLVGKINVPDEHVYKVIKTISEGSMTELSPLPTFIVKQFISMNEKYKYFERACRNGDMDIVKWSIQNGLPLEEFGDNGILSAWEGNQWDIVGRLIESGAISKSNSLKSISSLSNGRNETLLHLAAETDNSESVILLLRAGAEIEAQDALGKTPLLRAVEAGKESTANVLITHGANINHEVGASQSLLHVAAQRGNYAAANLLIKEGFSLNRKNSDGFTPLELAQRAGVAEIVNQLLIRCGDFHEHKNITQDLLDIRYTMRNDDICYIGSEFNESRSRNVFERDDSGLKNLTQVVKILVKQGAQSSFDYTLKSSLLFLAIENELSEAVNFLLETKLPLSDVSLGLQKAALGDEVQIIDYLLQAGADITLTDSDGWKPIHIAAANGNLKAVSFLLEKGDDLNSKTLKNETVLYIATLKGHSNVVTFLLDKRANVHLPTSEGWQPLHAATWKGQDRIVEMLLAKGADPNAKNAHKSTPLFEASRAGFKNVVKSLLDNGANVNSEAEGGRTPLFAAVWGGNPEVVTLLLNWGANINARDRYNKTSLYEASYYGITSVARVLLSRGARVDLAGVGEWTPLHIASRGGFTDIVRLLLQNGADVNSRTTEMYSPLYEASLHGHIDVAKILIEKGAYVDAVNAKGETPLQAARRKHFGNVVNLLKANGATDIIKHYLLADVHTL